MRAHTTKIATLVLAICALAVPAAAVAVPIDSGPYSVNATTGGSDDSSQSNSGSFSSVNSITGADESVPVSGSPSDGSGYSTVNAITGPAPSEPTLVSGSPGSADDGFEWSSAAIGAAAALSVAALGTAALLTLRRRGPVPPSAPSMS